jgi:cell division septation protein DedD
MHRRAKPVLLATALAVLAAGSTMRSSGQAAATPQSCLYMGEVRRTAILDDNDILFYMRNGTVYQNRLRNTCFSLRSVDRFTYGSSALRRLCVGDAISVLSDSTFGGAPFPTASCNLGSFLPIDRDVADDLVATALGKNTNEAHRRQVLKTEPVELPPATQPADAAAAPEAAKPANPPPAPAATATPAPALPAPPADSPNP